MTIKIPKVQQERHGKTCSDGPCSVAMSMWVYYQSVHCGGNDSSVWPPPYDLVGGLLSILPWHLLLGISPKSLGKRKASRCLAPRKAELWSLHWYYLLTWKVDKCAAKQSRKWWIMNHGWRFMGCQSTRKAAWGDDGMTTGTWAYLHVGAILQWNSNSIECQQKCNTTTNA